LVHEGFVETLRLKVDITSDIQILALIAYVVARRMYFPTKQHLPWRSVPGTTCHDCI
jgi:hypothetical protein